MMKRFLILAAAVAALSLSGCEKDPASSKGDSFSHYLFEYKGSFTKDVMDNLYVTYNLELNGKTIESGEFTDPDNCSVKVEEGIDTGTLVFSVNFKPKAGFPELKKEYNFAQEYEYSLMSFDCFGGVLDSDSRSSHALEESRFSVDDASDVDDFLEVMLNYLSINHSFVIKANHTFR